MKLLRFEFKKSFRTKWIPSTIYDAFTGRAEQSWHALTKRYGQTGLYYLYQMMGKYYVLFAILIGLFIFGNTISSESTRKKRGLSFYFGQPICKWALFFAKYSSGLIATISCKLIYERNWQLGLSSASL